MERYDAIKEIAKNLTDELVIANIGFPSRELYEIKDRAENFYMLGSMGLASSIGLGLGLSQDKKVIVLDGDGSILMNLGSLVTIFNQNPSNFILIALDNSAYGSTGNQETYCKNTDLLKIAKSIGFKKAFNFKDIDFKEILSEDIEEPIFIHFKINPGNADVGIIDLTPDKIKNRFKEIVNK
ncbi:sulfopyruvate decarboxylase subunit beta [Methanobrevibacter filiformis]|uniref:sulfopyruvate decarboxylase n=1 Tax=Methanobrevibacter filiformis TaxID=55758 RepID=A0A166AM51_9EURY|nr:sulfopyruvate decarboxylase subunit beta [Methanobrevibacter filiformis]KZX12218.1 acetolactate synthase isozyme 1 large subunit [Methanobrevibacter filiformis]